MGQEGIYGLELSCIITFVPINCTDKLCGGGQEDSNKFGREEGEWHALGNHQCFQWQTAKIQENAQFRSKSTNLVTLTIDLKFKNIGKYRNKNRKTGNTDHIHVIDHIYTLRADKTRNLWQSIN